MQGRNMNTLNTKLAKQLQEYVDKEHKFPASITIDKVKYNYGTFTEILANTVVNTESKHTGKQYGDAPNPTGDTINTTITKTDYIRIAREITTFYNTHKRCPNYVEHNKQKIRPKLFTYAFAKIINFYNTNKRLPSTCKFDSNVFMNKQAPSKTDYTDDDVANYFMKQFGKVTTIDEALGKVNNHEYAYYYDDVYNNKNAIDRMKNKQGINCTDSCQVFYHIAKALGYTVNVLHVQCSTGGHVRLQLKHSKHTSGNWINRDPACVLSNNNKPVTAIWCSNAPLNATNPKWFMDNVNR